MSDEEHEEQLIQAPTSSFLTYMSEGDQLYQKGAYAKAINSYTKALNLEPYNKNCLVARSRGYLSLGDSSSAYRDAETSQQDDKKFCKGLYRKAEALYSQGEFELALMFYHRGHKLRPDYKDFRLGIQKAQEAIDNSVGSPSSVKLENKGDLSFFYIRDENLAPKSKAQLRRQKQASKMQNKKVGEEEPKANKVVLRELLGELYSDKEYMEKLLKDDDLSQTSTSSGTTILDLIMSGIAFLDTRTEFWRQQKPIYARERDRRMRERNWKITREQERASPTKYILYTLEEIDQMLASGNAEDSQKKAKKLLVTVENWTKLDVPNKEEVIGNLYSCIGNAQIELGDMTKALENHKNDLELAQEHNLIDAKSRALDNIGRVYARIGQFADAVEVWMEKIPLAKTSLERTWLFHEIGRCHLELSNNEAARDFGEKSLSCSEESGDEEWKMNASVLVAQAEMKLNNYRAGVIYFEKALEKAVLLNDERAKEAILRALTNVNSLIVEKLKAEEIEKQKGSISSVWMKDEKPEELHKAEEDAVMHESPEPTEVDRRPSYEYQDLSQEEKKPLSPETAEDVIPSDEIQQPTMEVKESESAAPVEVEKVPSGEVGGETSVPAVAADVEKPPSGEVSKHSLEEKKSVSAVAADVEKPPSGEVSKHSLEEKKSVSAVAADVEKPPSGEVSKHSLEEKKSVSAVAADVEKPPSGEVSKHSLEEKKSVSAVAADVEKPPSGEVSKHSLEEKKSVSAVAADVEKPPSGEVSKHSLEEKKSVSAVAADVEKPPSGEVSKHSLEEKKSVSAVAADVEKPPSGEVSKHSLEEKKSVSAIAADVEKPPSGEVSKHSLEEKKSVSAVAADVEKPPSGEVSKHSLEEKKSVSAVAADVEKPPSGEVSKHSLEEKKSVSAVAADVEKPPSGEVSKHSLEEKKSVSAVAADVEKPPSGEVSKHSLEEKKSVSAVAADVEKPPSGEVSKHSLEEKKSVSAVAADVEKPPSGEPSKHSLEVKKSVSAVAADVEKPPSGEVSKHSLELKKSVSAVAADVEKPPSGEVSKHSLEEKKSVSAVAADGQKLMPDEVGKRIQDIKKSASLIAFDVKKIPSSKLSTSLPDVKKNISKGSLIEKPESVDSMKSVPAAAADVEKPPSGEVSKHSLELKKSISSLVAVEKPPSGEVSKHSLEVKKSVSAVAADVEQQPPDQVEDRKITSSEEDESDDICEMTDDQMTDAAQEEQLTSGDISKHSLDVKKIVSEVSPEVEKPPSGEVSKHSLELKKSVSAVVADVEKPPSGEVSKHSLEEKKSVSAVAIDEEEKPSEELPGESEEEEKPEAEVPTEVAEAPPQESKAIITPPKKICRPAKKVVKPPPAKKCLPKKVKPPPEVPQESIKSPKKLCRPPAKKDKDKEKQEADEVEGTKTEEQAPEKDE
ncbi:outer dynein arm-docking complex subunit 4 isoform X19 [Callorhinchus milii]|uniref:outer dynein arm-docking complex subunit 4 isoform X19 n=1 Tax=Callorhinchus milii TaxID=7868 RepID=UPI001C3F9892|nr:outer dynein arm-docking complex subunit 4 isoform X19 [Callorhinchus milii]